jgi:hypothetical protein
MSQSPTLRTTVNNPASQQARATLIKDEGRAINTRRAMTELIDPSQGGRWAKPDRVTGAEPFVDYPRLPAGSPWAQTQPPPEEPLGIDLSYVEPCGTEEEIRRSLQLAEAAAAIAIRTTLPPSSDDSAAEVCSFFPSATLAQSPIATDTTEKGVKRVELSGTGPSFKRRRFA